MLSCSSPWLQFQEVPATHVVQSGETLHQLAFQYRLNPRTLAQWNGIGRDARIYRGGVLHLRPPLPGRMHPVHAPGQGRVASTSRPATRPRQSTPAAKPAVKPSVVSPAPSPGAQPMTPSIQTSQAGGPRRWQWPVRGELLRGFGGGSDGLDISVPAGTPVKAAASGKVVYGGSALKGYGLLLIVQHGTELMSAYAHTSELLIGEGEAVEAGQTIARSGLGPSQVPLLHFEVRRSGQPIDPLPLLPSP
nr:peptidoglycan DD-metalloendopeptidase family protein [Oceanococcus sp. HetDA_MAG_MS8]